MSRRKPSRLSTRVLCVAVAVCVWAVQRQAVLAQTKPETPAAPTQNQPAAAVQAQPGTPGALAAPQVPAKPQAGPPDPSRPGPEQARGATPTQPEIPRPTVELKPGEVPAIKFDTADYDFGRVPAGQQVLHDYWFANTGSGPLEILSVKPSCGCTVTGQYDHIVQPGESGKIPVKLSVGTHGGKMAKNISVYTNVPGEGAMLKLTLQGEVWLPVEVQPATVTFGRLTSEAASDPALVQKVTITSNTEEPVELTNVRSTNPLYRPEIKVIEPGKKFELLVSLASPPKSGNNAGTIEISTGIKESPTLSVPVNAFVAPDIEVMPATLALPAEIPTATTRQLFVKNNVKAPIELSALESSNPNMKVTLDETQKGATYKLTVEVPAGHQVPAAGDKITFKTNNPTIPLITVLVSQARPPTPAPVPGQTAVAAPATTPPANQATPIAPAAASSVSVEAKAPAVAPTAVPQAPAGATTIAPPPAPAGVQPGAGTGGKSNG